jgi:microcystin-dependent protein
MDPFTSEIRMFGFNFAPLGWALCNGQLMPISQNTALFSLVGTYYGGDGKSTFALPDMQGAAPMFFAYNGAPGLSARYQGETGGSSTVTLLESEIPAHAHALMATNSPADVSSPTATTPLARSTGKQAYAPSGANVPLQLTAVAPTGGDQPHNNLMPYLVLNFCIALQGVFPPRT